MATTLVTTFQTFSTAARAGSIGGTEDWGTEGNAVASDNSYAIYTTNAFRPWSGHTIYLTASNLLDEVPAGATIDGIAFNIEKNESASDLATWTMGAVYVIKGGTIQTTENKAGSVTLTTSDTTTQHGGADQLWGVTWTADDINAAGFGVAISIAIASDDGENTSVPRIDYVEARITYTEAATSAPSRSMMGVGT